MAHAPQEATCKFCKKAIYRIPNTKDWRHTSIFATHRAKPAGKVPGTDPR